MLPVRRVMLRLRAIFGRRTIENDMQAEMREHLARSAQRLVERGMAPDDARLEARREFGNVTVLQEEGRDARGARWIDEISGDVRFAARYFARHKTTVALIITVLALGTGANALIFSIFQSEFLRPPPAIPSDANQARIWSLERATKTGRWEQRDFTQPEMLALAARRELFSDVAAWVSDDIVLDGGDTTGARGLGAQFVSSNFFSALGVRLSAGQGFAQSANGSDADLAAVLSFPMAEQLFGSPSAAIGRRIRVNEIPVHVVGVAPIGFQGALRRMNDPALWMPLGARAQVARISPRWLTDEATLSLFARLAPGASREQATAFARQVVTNALPDSATRVGMARTADVLGMRAPPPGQSNESLLGMLIMLMIGALILLVAWTNVSSLMVAAAVRRRHEIAVRLSLGASRSRLLRQLMTESTVLAITGGAIGLTLAWWTLLWAQKVNVGVDVVPDFWTFTFVLATAIVTGILFGLSPALHATRAGVASALRDSGTGTVARSRLQRAFVSAQIVLSQPLLVLLGAIIMDVVADYQPLAPTMSQQVISARFKPLTKTGATTQREEAVDALVPRIAGRAEILGAVPEPTGFAIRGVVATDRVQSDTSPTIVHVEGTAPGWFALVDVPVILGRDVSLADTASADYRIVIGSDLARKLWGNANPIGRTLPSPPVRGLNTDSITMTVVGVYDASRRLPGMSWGGGAARGDKPERVFSAHGRHWRHDAILVRTRGPAEPFLSDLQQFVRATAPALPVTSMATLAQVDAREYRDTLQWSLLAAGGGALALLLASLGLYGVVSLAVQQRTREIGIRIAVGAAPMRVARMFLASGVRVSGVALLVGLPISVAAFRLGVTQGAIIAPAVNVYLVGVVIGVMLLGVASAATWLPARRAARVDPATTLRVE